MDGDTTREKSVQGPAIESTAAPRNLSEEEEQEMPYEQIRKAYKFPFDLFPYQIERVEKHAHSDLAGFYWEPGCVDADTEYLTPTGWKRICEYTGGKVAQYHPQTGVAEFVKPTRWIKAPCREMIRVKTATGVDQKLSPEHRVLVHFNGARDPHVVTAYELLLAHNEYHAGLPGRLGPGTFAKAAITASYSTRPRRGSSLPLSQDQLRLQVAVIERGRPVDGGRCRLRTFSARETSHVLGILKDAAVEHTLTTADRYTEVVFVPPLNVWSYTPEFWKADLHQTFALYEATLFWAPAGGEGRLKRYSTTVKHNADFVQHLWTTCGDVCRIAERHPKQGDKRKVLYRVIQRAPARNPEGMMLHLRSETKPTVWWDSNHEGHKYCFEVPSGFLVLRRNGCIFATGNSGKTAGLTHWALFRSMEGAASQWIGIMPPILLDQWAAWLSSIKDADTGEPLTVSIYRGTPGQRKKVDLTRDFVLMSYVVFKNDYEHLLDFYTYRDVGVFCDEAHAIKNIESQTHKAVRHFSEGRPLALLTGTPLTSLDDAYAYIRLMAPGLYRNKRHFEKLHVAEMGDYEKVLVWANQDLLAENMKVNTSRVLRREVRDQVPPITYTPVVYKLDPAHYRLYERIGDEQLAQYEGVGLIPEMSLQATRAAMQQVIVNWAEFAQDESLRPAVFDLIDEIMEELGDGGKLVIVANFIRTNRTLKKYLANYNAVAIYGEVSPKEKAAAIDKFINDASCRVMQIQPQSAGYGVDGLQTVCSDMLFVEAPGVPPPFHQTVARLDREGQTRPINCRVAIASGTVQVRMFKNLLSNDETVNAVQGGYQDLREAIFGN